jgi:class 3 adenylate cyclase/pimeloyl-ACP methyl ester carboxylesterase
MPIVPETRFARSGEIDIAFQQFGFGDRDFVVMPAWISHLEVAWELPEYADFLERLGRLGRVLVFDKRGTGLSDRPTALGTLEDHVGDLRAVMDDAGVDHAFILGWYAGAAIAIGLAVTEPTRADGLMLGDFASGTADELETEGRHAVLDAIASRWGQGAAGQVLAPSLGEDARFLGWLRRWERQAATPRAAAVLQRWAQELDVSTILGAVHVPTLVLARRDSTFVPVGAARATAQQIPAARFVEVPGTDWFPFLGDSTAILDALEEFVTGSPARIEPERVLITALFTDIVGSTELAAQLGDQRWKLLLGAHNDIVRRLLDRFGGQEVDTAGDGFFARFDGPARAIRCASAIREAVHDIGVVIRAGIHTGEAEIVGNGLAGIAVHVAARASALAGADDIVVTQTVKDLVLGSGIEFTDRGWHELKGVPDSWRLYALDAVP